MYFVIGLYYVTQVIRDRPFNFARGGGDIVFFFVQKFFFGQHEFFFGRAKGEIVFPEFNIRLYDKNSESDFFFLHQNQNIFLGKNHNPPPPFQVKWSFPNDTTKSISSTVFTMSTGPPAQDQ